MEALLWWSFAQFFLGENGTFINVSTVADHIDHIRNVSGIDHVGYGSDFDGCSEYADGLTDVSMFPNLTAELIRRGYSDNDIQKVIGGNFLRVLQQAEAVAGQYQR